MTFIMPHTDPSDYKGARKILTAEVSQLPGYEPLYSFWRAAHAGQDGQALHFNMWRPWAGTPPSRALNVGLEHLGEGQG